MRFRGQLLLPSEPGPGLPVDIEVANHRLAVVSDTERLGAWPLDSVKVRRIGGDTFAMTVAGEDLHFIADDTISFAYSGVPAIERVTPTSTARSHWRSLRGLFAGRSAETDPGGGEAPAEAASPPLAVEETTADTVVAGAGAAPPPKPDEKTFTTHHPAPPKHPEAEPKQARSDEDPSGMVIDLADGNPAPVGDLPGAETESPTCPALRQDGEPCRSPIIGPSGFCYAHDPEREVQSDLRKAQEARARLKEKGAARLARVYRRLDRALRQVERGELDPETAMAMAQLARTMCAILDLDDDPEADSESAGAS